MTAKMKRTQYICMSNRLPFPLISSVGLIIVKLGKEVGLVPLKL